jgi:SsrA-binding protein
LSKPDTKKPNSGDETIAENRKARHDYFVEETLECGIVLQGSEVKSVRDRQVSIAEGFCRVQESPPTLSLHQVHIGEYAPAGALGHRPVRSRILLAKRGEIVKIARKMTKGMTIVPLKMYFKDGWAKVLIGICKGKQAHDKRQSIAKRDAQRDMQRAMSRRA